MSSFSRGCRGGALLCALALALPLAQARELAPIDALGDAPVALQRKAAQALPAQVQRLTREERLGVPTFVQLRPAAMPSAQTQAKAAIDPVSAARTEFKALAGLYGLTPQEVDAAEARHVQTLPGGARLVRLTQQRDGIEVFREQATVLLNAQSQATAIGGYLAGTATVPVAKAAPAMRLDAPGALARVLQDWGFAPGVDQQLREAAPPVQRAASPYQWWSLPEGVAGADGATLLRPARTKPVWFRLPQGLVAAYYVEVLVREDGEEHAYAYVVAADDGQLLLRHSQTSHADYSYRAWAETVPPFTPLPGAQGRNGVPHPTGVPDGYAAPLVLPSLVTLGSAPFSKNDPWLPNGAAKTEGNNVRAFANLRGEGWGPVDGDECAGPLVSDFRACTTAPGVFDHFYDGIRLPLADRGQAAASVVNLFYTTNWLHDWFYDAGFDEAAGNAQADNFSRGGLEGDAMDAQALDFSGTDNANMYTPADGAPPRMRMYRFLNTATQATVTAPVAAAGGYAAAGAAFGPQNFDVTGAVVAAAPADGCSPPTNAVALAGKIALVARGSCEFTAKALNAQNAGAVALVVVNNSADGPSRMGTGAGGGLVTIPAIHVAQATGGVWQAQAPVTLHMQAAVSERSSALDNAIIAHEWGHFISNRLIGDASGLTTNHARGLGEGWGDFHALLLVVSAADINIPSNANWSGAFGIGGYATAAAQGADAANIALYGLRRYPYSADMAKNPLVLRHITDGVALPATAPRNPGVGGANAEVHNMGEVWAGMLWEFYAALLRAHPFQEAQDRMKQYLVAGYKLTPVNPTLVEARDALLAVTAANDPADFQRGINAFSKRGAGAFALVPDRYSDTNAGVVESYYTGGALVMEGAQLSMAAPQAQRCDADGVLDSGETGVLSFTVRNQGFTLSDSAQLVLSADTAGVSFPDGATVSVPGIAAGTATTVTARVQLAGMAAPGGTRITGTLQTQPGQPGGFLAQQTLDLPLHRDVLPARLAADDAEALPGVMEFGSSAAGHSGAWAVRGYAPMDHRYAGTPPEAIGAHWMRTPALQVAATGNFTVTFQHRYRFEQSDGKNWDGGQLMVSTNGGATWTSVNGAAAGYTGTINGGSGNPAEGQGAYVGQSPGWPALTTARVNLGTAFAGQSVRLAWVMQTDPAASTEGWEVDDIVFTGITDTPFPQVVPDMQTCSPGLVTTDGTPQAATVDTAFGWPLAVRLRGPAGAPLAGQTVTFAVPSSGASATLSSSTAVTDANGQALVSAIANGTTGSYTVTATAGGHTTRFLLTNTPVPLVAGTLSAAGGTPQSAPVGMAFAQPLRVRVLDTNGAPLADEAVNFAAPSSGASGTLSSSMVLTDASGEAAVTVTGNGTVGSYAVAASHAGFTASFALRNTAVPVGTGGGGGGPLAISGPSPRGQGTVTATVQNPPANAYFSHSVFNNEAGAGAPLLAGRSFPFGLVGFVLENVGPHGSVTLRIQYPAPVPPGAEYWKYDTLGTLGWHRIPMVQVSADTIEITLTDGGQGDVDGQADGTITDPGGLAVLAAPSPGPGGAAAIPTLSPFALALLAAALGLLGWRRRGH